MKQILLALAIISLGYTNADAKGKKSTYAKNYPICLSGSTYKVCPAPKTSEVGRDVTVNDPTTSLRMMDTYVHMGYGRTGFSDRHNPRIRVTIDDPHAPYEGKESMVNDGVQKNKQRNLNANTGVELPPNDGGLSDK
jgi:hypothetical protein